MSHPDRAEEEIIVPAETPQTRPAALPVPASPREGPNSVTRKKFYFDDVFADIMLVHTLNHATFKGAEIGECLAAASKVAEEIGRAHV